MHQAFSTRAVHAGRKDLHRLGVHAPPIDLSSTYPIPDLSEAAASLAAMAEGRPPLGNPVYARLHNPTTARFEQGLAELEGAGEAVAFASGMAAVSACLLAARQRGDHVLAIRPLYGGTDHLLASELLGLQVDFVSPDELAAALRPTTALVILETPGNPTLDLVDIAAVVEIAGQVPVLVDSTFATPVLQQPLALGARLVLHSGTKYLGGHGDVLAGVVATDDPAWADSLRAVRVATGAVLHPLAAFLLHRGLATLPLRVRASQAGAEILAGRLARHPLVERVRFPGLPGEDPLGIVGRQMAGPGAMLAFELSGGRDAATRLMAALRLITPAVSLGSVDSLIQHPAGLTHQVVDAAAKASSGISEGLLRLSVGLEDPEDLWEDLARGLEASQAAAPLVRFEAPHSSLLTGSRMRLARG
ncbi:MAG: PLP-dependent transferase [Chloroflexi bacterium]|nr:PLP-dependent transferase [Chloroflexota bacterium]